eukprot:jgi/Mesen1/4298/ME000022S03590
MASILKAYEKFWVGESNAAWESHRGGEVCSLYTLFKACESIFKWLMFDENYVAVLHVWGPPGTRGGTFLRFVAACYLKIYGADGSAEADSALEHFEGLPPAPGDDAHWRPQDAAAAAAAPPGDRAGGAHASAAQRRYCHYVDQLVNASSAHNVKVLRKSAGAVVLRHLVLLCCPSLDGADGCRLYVFACGKEVYGSCRDGEVSPYQLTLCCCYS